MDNVTHSLAGMLVAEAFCTLRRETRAELRSAAYLLSALANNLPDIDVVYSSWLTGPKPLGYLLHHRGHTHTLLFALTAACLLYWVALRLWRRKGVAFAPDEARVLLGLCLVGPLLHLLMDLGNNYGVHPFWPVSGRWFYGDTIFIIEPLWLVLTIPVLSHTLTRRWLKVLLWLVLLGVLVVCWFVPFVLPASRYLLVVLAVVAYLVGGAASERARVAFAVSGCLLVAAAFAIGSLQAKATMRRASEAAYPALEIHDIAATPMPANPRCWEGLLVGEQGGVYRVVRTSIALSPLSAEACQAGAGVEPSAETRLLAREPRHGVRFLTEYSADLRQLQARRRDDCRFRALLQFARVPYLTDRLRPTRSSRAGLFAGDLRFDRQPDLDFADMILQRDPQVGPCPRLLPGWTEPRMKLFPP